MVAATILLNLALALGTSFRRLLDNRNRRSILASTSFICTRPLFFFLLQPCPSLRASFIIVPRHFTDNAMPVSACLAAEDGFVGAARVDLAVETGRR